MNELLNKGIGHTEFRDSELGRIPKSWATTTLSKLVSATDLFCDGDWVESKDQDPLGTNRLIQLADIGDGKFLNKSRRFMNNKQFENLCCTELKPDDILIARMPDPIGRACLFPHQPYRCATAVDVAILRLSSVDNYWLMSKINSSWFRQIIENNTTGTTRTRISRSKLSKILFSLPPLPEQKKIAAILTSIDDQVSAAKQKLNQTQSLKKSLMQDLLTGRVRVST